MSKGWIVAGIFLLIAIAAIGAAIAVASRDIPLPDASDLAVERPEIAPEDNAYTYFLAAANARYWPDDPSVITDFLAGKPADLEALAEIVAKNEGALQSLVEGVRRRRCLTPEIADFNTRLPHLSPWLHLGKVSAAKIRRNRLAGRYADATETCIVLLRFGDRVQSDAEGLIHYLIGVALLDSGLEQARDLARDDAMPDEDRRRLAAALGEIGPFDAGLARAIKVEYRLAANTIDRIRDGTLKVKDLTTLGGTGGAPPRAAEWRLPRYAFQPNRTKRLMADLYRGAIADAPLCFAEMKRRDIETALGLRAGRWKRFLQPNSVGKILCAMLVPSLDSLLEKKCRIECDLAATRILLAAQSFRRSHGRLPDRLQELVPDFLPAVPADPFDGQEFRYSASAGAIYSVGKDLKDSGGSATLPAGGSGTDARRRRWESEDVVYELDIETAPR